MAASDASDEGGTNVGTNKRKYLSNLVGGEDAEAVFGADEEPDQHDPDAGVWDEVGLSEKLESLRGEVDTMCAAAAAPAAADSSAATADGVSDQFLLKCLRQRKGNVEKSVMVATNFYSFRNRCATYASLPFHDYPSAPTTRPHSSPPTPVWAGA